jgi:exodeoxyribonuclease VIII
VKREPGPRLIEDFDIGLYHAHPAISKSGLDSIELSPAIYFARHLNPFRPPAKEKAGQLEGNLAHCMILEPAEFDKRYVVGPEVNRNTKVWKEFVETNANRVAIQPEQMKTATHQAMSVRTLPDVADLLANGKPEVSAFWRDEDTGAECRCRPDWVHPARDDAVILMDVKTYSIASVGEFSRQVARKAYDKQAAFYTDGYEKASGKTVLGFVFVAVENEFPYAANAFMLDEDSLEAGRQKYRKNLRTYAECMRTEKWPGYSNGINLIRLPSWALFTED